ncbi:MAG: hypothetical protein V7638_4278 [Acidobacteriota bacterium]
MLDSPLAHRLEVFSLLDRFLPMALVSFELYFDPPLLSLDFLGSRPGSVS